MNNYIFKSNFKQEINNFLEFKYAIGYKMWVSQFYLHIFDKFCIEYFPNENNLTSELVRTWALRQENESLLVFISLVRFLHFSTSRAKASCILTNFCFP